MKNARETTARLMETVKAVLNEREERTRAILETTVDGIITISELGIIESFNSAAERIFGYTAAEVIYGADYVRLEFCDTGVGLPAEDLERVFEPFYSTKGERGTGLDLAICRQIIDAHRGAIYLSSTPGAGTTVTIELLHANATL